MVLKTLESPLDCKDNIVKFKNKIKKIKKKKERNLYANTYRESTS